MTDMMLEPFNVFKLPDSPAASFSGPKLCKSLYNRGISTVLGLYTARWWIVEELLPFAVNLANSYEHMLTHVNSTEMLSAATCQKVNLDYSIVS